MESGNVSRGERRRPLQTVLETTNGSSQNQPPADTGPTSRTRKRGISALLQDISNGPIQLQCRRAGQQAKRMLESLQSSSYAPRGDPVQGAVKKHRNAEPVAAVKETLHQLRDKAVSTSIAETLLSFTQRNATYEIQKANAITIMATAISKWDCSVVNAANWAASCCGFNAEAVRRWASAFATSTCSVTDMTDDSIQDILSSKRGYHDNHTASLIHDESFSLAARQYVCKHACRKGEPNLTCKMFAEWVHTEYGVNISEETARTWLLELGFCRMHHQKGVYFDGHERDDVVTYRKQFLREIDKKSLTCNSNTPVLDAGEKPLIRVVHDECTFFANSDQTYFWEDDETNVLRQKSLGASIMVSDFIDEVSGYICDEQDQGRLMLETQRDGYFTNDLLLHQVERTVDIFERVHPQAQALFLCDNAPSHRKLAEDTPNADKMNVGRGGKQPKMRDTQWAGGIQKLVDETDIPKGMRIVLEERGINTTGMKASDMRQKLKTFPDFNQQQTILEKYIEQRGHLSKVSL